MEENVCMDGRATMRVVHLSTFDCSGGAASAARGLVEGQRQIDCDARMLVRDKTCSASHIVGASPVVSKRRDEASLIQRKLINPNRTPISNTWFSLPVPGYDLVSHEEVLRADLLHLHWVSGFLSPGAVRRLQETGKPILWTLHDQRPFTGGCHFSAGCSRYERDCEPCPQLARQWGITGAGLAETLRCVDASRLTIVCPSRWMAACAQKSAAFSRARIEVIPNGVNTTAFKAGRQSVRRKLGISDSALVLLTGMDCSGELRKGPGLLAQALTIAKPAWKNTDVKVVAFGASTPPRGFDFPALWAGRIESREELASYYRAADAFLLSSVEDNLPNTMLEALCCGTPVIGFKIGGVPDAVTHRVNGILAEEASATSFADAIRQFRDAFSGGTFSRDAIASAALERFSLQTQARAHLRLYEELLARPTSKTAFEVGVETQEFAMAFEGLMRQARKERWRKRWLRLAERMSFRSRASAKGGDDEN